MGNAEFCPQCGEVIGGWDYEDLSDCQCITGIDSNSRIRDWDKAMRYMASLLDEGINSSAAVPHKTRAKPGPDDRR